MAKPVEIHLFDYLTEQIEAAADGDVLYGLDLHDTVYQSITKERPRGIRISDAIGEMSPTSTGINEYNVELQIVCFVKVEGADKKFRQDALQAVYEIESEVARVLFTDPSLGNRVCDISIEPSPRSYDVFDSNPYAIALMPVVINKGGWS